MNEFYIFKFSECIFDICHTLLYRWHRKDFTEFLLHDIVTTGLISFSYTSATTQLGGIVMLTHDYSDVMVSFCKFNLQISASPVLALVSYLNMVAHWVYLRILFFPIRLIAAVYHEGFGCHPQLEPIMMLLFVFISILYFLHCFWFIMIVRAGVRRWKNGDKNAHEKVI